MTWTAERTKARSVNLVLEKPKKSESSADQVTSNEVTRSQAGEGAVRTERRNVTSGKKWEKERAHIRRHKIQTLWNKQIPQPGVGETVGPLLATLRDLWPGTWLVCLADKDGDRFLPIL
jgi:hypothetical protein